MAATVTALRDIGHITPIACPACKTGKASLVERRSERFGADDKSEIWVFECDSCGAMSVQPVD